MDRADAASSSRTVSSAVWSYLALAFGWFWFVVILLAGWGILSLHYLWQVKPELEFHLEPLYILPAIVPAWILSAALSKDNGIRGLIERLGHRPTPRTLTQYILLRGVTLIPLTIILTWFYNRSNRSIQATAMFHASMNTTPFVLPYFPPAWGLIFAWAGYAIVKDKMWRRA